MSVSLSPLAGAGWQFFDNNGVPLNGGLLYTYAAGTTTPTATYTSDNGVTANANPIVLDSAGRTPSEVWLTDGTTYKIAVYTSTNVLIRTWDDIAGVNDPTALTALQTALASSTGSSMIGFIQAGTGAVARTAQSKMRDVVNVKDFGIIADGITNQTAALLVLMSSLSSSLYRGVVNIPYGTKFDVSTVYAAVPLGVILQDESSINWGQPPSYKNKFLVTYSGDNVSDDTQEIIASPHHPALMLLNMGTDTSGAAASRYATILQGVGKDYAGDPLLGWIYQFAKDPSASQWRVSLRLQTPYSVAIKNPQPWVTSTVYAAAAYCVSDNGKIYTTTAGGTSGATAPTGTGASISDGGVTWSYVQAALNIDSTRFEYFEDGKSGQYAPVGGIARHTMQAGPRSMFFEIDDTTDDLVWRDESRILDVARVSDAGGLVFGTAQSLNRLSVTGTGPNAPLTGAGKVENSSATNMSTMVPPAGRNRIIVSLRFDNGNTTVVHGTGTNNLSLKGGVNASPALGQFMTFEYDSVFTNRWLEVSRSF